MVRYKQFPEYQLKHYNISLQEYKFIYFMEWFHRMWGRAIGVDSFAGTDGESAPYPDAMLDSCRVFLDRCWVTPSVVQMTSLAAAAALPSALDYVFLDAAHDYENIRADIAAWWPKIKPGGWLAGHDSTDAAGVRRAVDEAFPHAEKLGTCWLVQKPFA